MMSTGFISYFVVLKKPTRDLFQKSEQWLSLEGISGTTAGLIEEEGKDRWTNYAQLQNIQNCSTLAKV